jgi:hypothetical protein
MGFVVVLLRTPQKKVVAHSHDFAKRMKDQIHQLVLPVHVLTIMQEQEEELMDYANVQAVVARIPTVVLTFADHMKDQIHQILVLVIVQKIK